QTCALPISPAPPPIEILSPWRKGTVPPRHHIGNGAGSMASGLFLKHSLTVVIVSPRTASGNASSNALTPPAASDSIGSPWVRGDSYDADPRDLSSVGWNEFRPVHNSKSRRRGPGRKRGSGCGCARHGAQHGNRLLPVGDERCY